MPVGGVNDLKAEVQVAQAESPDFEKVHWLKDPGLRKLYFWASVLCIASATTGYDGYVYQYFLRSQAVVHIYWH